MSLKGVPCSAKLCFLLKKYLFIYWLHWVLVVALEVFGVAWVFYSMSGLSCPVVCGILVS